MGYWRTLYMGPVLVIEQKEGDQRPFYTAFDHVSEKWSREDRLHLLQRHVNPSEFMLGVGHFLKGENFLVDRDPFQTLEEEPCHFLSDLDTKKETQWMLDFYKPEIVILEAEFQSVRAEWAIVVDGA